MMDENFERFIQVHKGIPRQAPGSIESTKLVCNIISQHIGFSPKNIVDVGCGPGNASVELAKKFEGSKVLALDKLPMFVEETTKKWDDNKIGSLSTLEAKQGDMFELPKLFKENEFDILFAEGSIYIIGFHKGLSEWRHLVKKGGFIAVSELTWLTENSSEIPDDVAQFWNAGYPAMKTISGNLQVIQSLKDLHLVSIFVLPASDWNNYYNPLQKNVDQFRLEKQNEDSWKETLDGIQAEIDLFRRHGEHYGYVFYIMKKGDTA